MGDFFDYVIESARDPLTQRLNQSMLLPRSFIIPKNGNIQTVWPDLKDCISRAKRFKPPFREYAMELAINNLEGVAAISSEGGAFVKEFNTTRGTVSPGQVEGQPATWFDEYVYGKDKMKNNPKDDSMGLEI